MPFFVTMTSSSTKIAPESFDSPEFSLVEGNRNFDDRRPHRLGECRHLDLETETDRRNLVKNGRLAQPRGLVDAQTRGRIFNSSTEPEIDIRISCT